VDWFKVQNRTFCGKFCYNIFDGHPCVFFLCEKMYPQLKNRKKILWQKHDYSSCGFYFVTICIQNMECVFGDVKNGKMILNVYGEIVKKCWINIPRHFKHVQLDEFVVMPNHIHGIINMQRDVGNADLRSLRTNDRTKMKLPKIIHGFKSSVTRIVRQTHNDYTFAWQRSFYDHIIRNDADLQRIRKYIKNNPKNTA